MTAPDHKAETLSRENLGRKVREAWIAWAETQPNPKPSWLVPYDELSEPDKEADRQIGEALTAELKAALESVMWQAQSDMDTAHTEICRLAGLDPKTHDWPEWSPQANSRRWHAELREKFGLDGDRRPSPAPDNGGEGVSDERLRTLEKLAQDAANCDDMGGVWCFTKWAEKSNDSGVLAAIAYDDPDNTPLTGCIERNPDETYAEVIAACEDDMSGGVRAAYIAAACPATVRSIVAELLALRRSTFSAGVEDALREAQLALRDIRDSEFTTDAWAQRTADTALRVIDRALSHPHQIKEGSE